MTSRLARLRALHAAATQGKWETTHNSLHEESRVYAGAHLRAFLDGRVLLGQREDADSIAANHNALPSLLACVDALRAVAPDHPALAPLLEEQP